jgi:hypothetical protein
MRCDLQHICSFSSLGKEHPRAMPIKIVHRQTSTDVVHQDLLNQGTQACTYKLPKQQLRTCRMSNDLYSINLGSYTGLQNDYIDTSVSRAILDGALSQDVIQSRIEICARHSKVLLQLQVKPSTHGGRGLFTTRNIEPGERFAVFYSNIPVQPAVTDALYGSECSIPYGLTNPDVDNDTLQADDLLVRDFADYANDCRDLTTRLYSSLPIDSRELWTMTTAEEALCNSFIDSLPADPRLSLPAASLLQALRPIRKGEEILLDYGLNYWQGCYTQEWELHNDVAHLKVAPHKNRT